MTADWTSILVPLVLFVATFIRSAFGFGEALIAVPLLALLMPIDVAAPVAVLASIVVAGFVVAQDWRHVHFRSASRLVLATLFGTPLGLLLLTAVDERIVKSILAVGIVAFASFCLLSRRQAALADDRTAWLFGFCAGVLGGAYGMNGPPLVIYGSLRGWSPQHFRATLQGYFLPASLLVFGGYWLTGLWIPTVTRHFLIALPAIVAAILLGRLVNQRMRGPSFLRYLHIGLIAVGFVLLAQSVA
ncbi:MAG: sulfite exporter TauE/SafE family protein [Planctomycetaceae bacterium]